MPAHGVQYKSETHLRRTAEYRREPINHINRQDMYSRNYVQRVAEPKSAALKNAETLLKNASKTDREATLNMAKKRVYYILVVAAVFFMSAIMIYRHTAIFGMNREIDKLSDEYNNIMVTNEEIRANINKSVELGNLESIAKNELGMISPSSSQVFYVDMENSDEVVKSKK